MLVLGIETSCDETSAAVVEDGRLLSNITRSQLFHSAYGGVVPELASREHQKLVVPIVEAALAKAHVSKDRLDGVAAVYGPGLIGSILVGLSFGKAYAFGLGIPFVGVNHMQAHVVSNLIEDPKPGFPFLNLTASGGHTQLVKVQSPLEYTVLGETRDDAAGEAFDKVAKMLGIGYPGGPLIDRIAKKGNPRAVTFPRSFLDDPSFDFSFSGLKTSVLYYLRRMEYDAAGRTLRGKGGKEAEGFVADVCASFQSAVVEVLVEKTLRAARQFDLPEIAVAGGVAANSELRAHLQTQSAAEGRRVFTPPIEFCTDNGAMVALAGYYRLLAGARSEFELAAVPNLELHG